MLWAILLGSQILKALCYSTQSFHKQIPIEGSGYIVTFSGKRLRKRPWRGQFFSVSLPEFPSLGEQRFWEGWDSLPGANPRICVRAEANEGLTLKACVSTVAKAVCHDDTTSCSWLSRLLCSRQSGIHRNGAADIGKLMNGQAGHEPKGLYPFGALRSLTAGK